MKLPWHMELATDLSSPIESRMIAGGVRLARHSMIEQTIAGPLTAMALIGNGGIPSWFDSMDGPDTTAAADAFERLGLPAAAADLRAAQRAQESGAALEDLSDDGVYAARPLVHLAVLKFARANRDELLRLRPELRQAFARLDDLDQRVPPKIRQLAQLTGMTADKDLERALADRDYGKACALVISGEPLPGNARAFWPQARELADDLGMKAQVAQADWHIQACQHGVAVADLQFKRWANTSWSLLWTSGDGGSHRALLYPEPPRDYDVGEHARVRLTSDSTALKNLAAGKELAILDADDRSVLAVGPILQILSPS